MAAPILSIEERTFLESLIRNNVRFMIVGLTSAVLQGAHVVTQDIDLWVEDLGSTPFLKAVEEAKGFYIAPGVAGTNPPMLGPNELRIFDFVTHMHGLQSFDEEYSQTTDIEISGISVKVLNLDRIIASKRAAGREKDKASLPALEAVLVVQKQK